jgi:hypothetical protein
MCLVESLFNDPLKLSCATWDNSGLKAVRFWFIFDACLNICM